VQGTQCVSQMWSISRHEKQSNRVGDLVWWDRKVGADLEPSTNKGWRLLSTYVTSYLMLSRWLSLCHAGMGSPGLPEVPADCLPTSTCSPERRVPAPSSSSTADLGKLSRALHYRLHNKRPAARGSEASWEGVAEAFKESSRARARHIAVELRDIDCVIVPLRDWDAADFEFHPRGTRASC
jgi:hypothetical protein